MYFVIQGEWGLTEEDSIADIKRQADFTKTFLPSAKAQIRVLNQSYHVSPCVVFYQPHFFVFIIKEFPMCEFQSITRKISKKLILKIMFAYKNIKCLYQLFKSRHLFVVLFR